MCTGSGIAARDKKQGIGGWVYLVDIRGETSQSEISRGKFPLGPRIDRGIRRARTDRKHGLCLLLFGFSRGLPGFPGLHDRRTAALIIGSLDITIQG